MPLISSKARLLFLLPFLLLGLLIAGPARAATPEEVDAAIVKAQKWLLAQQHPTGQWETDLKRVGDTHNAWRTMQGDSFGGYTALATYALLASGVDADDPAIQKAVTFLRSADMIGIYAIGIRANVWLLIPKTNSNQQWLTAAIQHDRDKLLGSLVKSSGPYMSLWGYNDTGVTKTIDHSVSQYGVLGLWACEQAGASVPYETWGAIDYKWRQDQFPDGHWEYDGTPTVKAQKSNLGPSRSASMTAAGIATLFITQDYLYDQKSAVCNGNIGNENIELGLDWIAKNFGSVTTYYSTYGMERIGVASGRKYFGSHDWFSELSTRLVKQQRKDGSWSDNEVGGTPLDSTAFCLLFLARGRAAVMVNKLEYTLESPPPNYSPIPRPADGKAPPPAAGPVEGHWNQRPRDVANLVRWFGRQSEADLNWQVVTLNESPQAMIEAPVLYLAGDTPLSFKPEEMKRMRDFVNLGGMILGNADCRSEDFSAGFEKLGKDLFGREFRQLPGNHPIYTQEQFPASRWKERPTLRGLSNGIRELMILIPQDDAARYWQTRADLTHADLYQLGADILMYSVDKHPAVKGRTHIVVPNPKIVCDKKMTLGLLQIGDDWNPEPGAWAQLAAVMHNAAKVELQFKQVKLSTSELSGLTVLHWTGTAAVKLDEGQRSALLEWVNHGGTLIVDAAGGNAEFADSVEAELKSIFGDDAQRGLSQALQPDHPLFGLPKLAITDFSYRPFARSQLVGDMRACRLHGIEHNGKIKVFYSREDITGGLVGESVDGIIGYTPKTAMELMRNMILYSSSRRR